MKRIQARDPGRHYQSLRRAERRKRLLTRRELIFAAQAARPFFPLTGLQRAMRLSSRTRLAEQINNSLEQKPFIVGRESLDFG